MRRRDWRRIELEGEGNRREEEDWEKRGRELKNRRIRREEYSIRYNNV
jgi:hypothetical protein